MDKEDTRNQTRAQLHERRKLVVRMPRRGLGVMKIVEMSGLSYLAVRAAIDRFEIQGFAAIKPTTPELNPDERTNADLKRAIARICRREPRPDSRLRPPRTCRYLSKTRIVRAHTRAILAWFMPLKTSTCRSISMLY